MQISSTLDPSTLDEPKDQASNTWVGLVIAGGIVSVWAISINVLLMIDLPSLPFAVKILILLWQTFLYTGLFVTAHDAMHGAVCARNRRLNNAVGMLVLGLYGLFSFRMLLQRHLQHHRFPASETDPDYQCSRFLGWYWAFMTRYWSWKRFAALVVMFHILHGPLGVPASNLAWAWIYPSVLSSMHLFYFGTFLPHRQPKTGYVDEHRSTTIPRPWLLSLLACYHFGYHREHHRFTNVPWWQLPRVYRQDLTINL
jgi:beta-carotene/zeaxanthin 4-ketolase